VRLLIPFRFGQKGFWFSEVLNSEKNIGSLFDPCYVLVLLREWFLGNGIGCHLCMIIASTYAYVGRKGVVCWLSIIIGIRGENQRLGGTYGSIKTDSKLDFYSQIPSIPARTTYI
jgi:hypothetical protein